MTPGQAAYEAWLTTLGDAGLIALPKDLPTAWHRLGSDVEREAWEAAEQAANADLRELVAEILGHLDDAGITVDDEIRSAWLERAGLENRITRRRGAQTPPSPGRTEP